MVAILEEENREILIKSYLGSLLRCSITINFVIIQRIKGMSKLIETFSSNRVIESLCSNRVE
jgi:hypothetical protein